jgi:hypothetical protein
LVDLDLSRPSLCEADLLSENTTAFSEDVEVGWDSQRKEKLSIANRTMPKLKCICSNVIDLTSIPCQQKYRLIHEKSSFDLYGIKPTTGDEVITELFLRSAQVFRCDNCGRLMIFWTRGQEKADVFKPEDPSGAGAAQQSE